MEFRETAQTFVFFGTVGSGKGTQVKLLMDFLKEKTGTECLYIGTGEIFREILSSSGEDDPISKTVREFLSAGRLVTDEMTNDLVLKKIDAEMSPDKHVLFDGFPRTVAQSAFFEEQMKTHGRASIKIIYLELSEQEAIKRNLLRGRHDDTEEGLKQRFNEYKNNVIPSMQYFKGKTGYNIFTINGEQTIEQVHNDIIKALNLQ